MGDYIDKLRVYLDQNPIQWIVLICESSFANYTTVCQSCRRIGLIWFFRQSVLCRFCRKKWRFRQVQKWGCGEQQSSWLFECKMQSVGIAYGYYFKCVGEANAFILHLSFYILHSKKTCHLAGLFLIPVQKRRCRADNRCLFVQ